MIAPLPAELVLNPADEEIARAALNQYHGIGNLPAYLKVSREVDAPPRSMWPRIAGSTAAVAVMGGSSAAATAAFASAQYAPVAAVVAAAATIVVLPIRKPRKVREVYEGRILPTQETYRLVRISEILTRKLLNSPAWSDSQTANIRARFDPHSNYIQMFKHADRIEKLIERAGSVIEDPQSIEATSANAAREGNRRSIDVLVDSLTSRTAALLWFTRQVVDLEPRLAALHDLEQQLALSGDIASEALQIGLDSVATDQLLSLAAEVRGQAEVIDKTLVALGSMIESPSEDGPRAHS